MFEVTQLDLALTPQGEELYSSTAQGLPGSVGDAQVLIPLPAGGGEELVLTAVTVGEPSVFPPLLRLTADPHDTAGTVAYANYAAIPAGAAALALALVWGLFLFTLWERSPNWKLLLLAFAAWLILSGLLTSTQGGYFLSPGVVQVFTWEGWIYLGVLAPLAYLVLHREKAFWQALGLLLLCSALILGGSWLVSALTDGYLSRYIPLLWSQVTSGDYDSFLHWVTLWLVFLCSILSLWEFLRKIIGVRTRNRSLEIKEQLLLSNYASLEERLREDAAARHEFTHWLVAIDSLAQQGDLEGVRQGLAQWKKQDAPLPRYTKNYTVNAILQDAAAKAKASHIRFSAEAQVPKDLPFPQQDLCSLLMNLLENALEGAAQVKEEDRRFLRIRVALQHGFLAVCCENSYSGNLRLDKKRQLCTTKDHPEAHGFGLPKMSAIAEKYHSVLDVRYTQDTFTVQTALSLPAAGR